jgi:hypothetical protein
MAAIRIETVVESETLYLPQLKPLVGKSVEIIVRAMPEQTMRTEVAPWISPLAGSVLEYIEPFEAAVPLDEWAASR